MLTSPRCAIGLAGRVEPGDELLNVGGASLQGRTHDGAVQCLLDAIRAKGPIAATAARDDTPIEAQVSLTALDDFLADVDSSSEDEDDGARGGGSSEDEPPTAEMVRLAHTALCGASQSTVRIAAPARRPRRALTCTREVTKPHARSPNRTRGHQTGWPYPSPHSALASCPRDNAPTRPHDSGRQS